MSDKIKKDAENKIIEMSSSAGSYIEKFLGDVSKKSASQQLIIGGISGWATGYSTMKIGKTAAFLVGGGIIMLRVATQQGWIEINWNKIHKKVDQVGDKIEGAVYDEAPGWMDKAERFVDRKLDQAESALKKKQKKVKKWYSNLIGDDTGPKINELHIFIGAFVGGVALGLASS